MENEMGIRLRELRKTAGLSQMKLADKVGVSYQQIQKYEKGSSQMSVKRLIQIAKIFEVHPMMLIDPQGEMVVGTCGNLNQTIEEYNLVVAFRKIKILGMQNCVQDLIKGIVRYQPKKGKV